MEICMKKMNIWFNHWFSTAYHIINLIKKDQDINFFVVGTNDQEDSVIKKACDLWEVEPKGLPEKEYIDYSLEFCQRNKIEIFVPRRNQFIISKNIKLFDKIGVKVLVERDAEKLQILQNKKLTYELFNDLELGYVPEYYTIKSSEEFKNAYLKLKENNDKICFKFVKDEGGLSFKVIDNNIDILYSASATKVSFADIMNHLEKRKQIPEIIMMPYLSGKEISVDCLNTADGLIAVPRFKTKGRTEVIKYDNEIMNISGAFFDKYGIQCPCNIQFRYHNNNLYLLEINTRMSGGIQYSCLASGINIPNIAINQLIGIHKKWIGNNEEKKVSYIEEPILF
jgi:predicted ATP-grasp superfamily ATP-dependent carboligase